MPEYDLSITITGHDKASKAFAPVESAMKRILEIAGGILASRVIMGIADQIFKLAASSIEATAQLQLMQVSLESLAARELVKASGGVKTLATVSDQAAASAGKMMDQLSRMAILSPYNVAAVQNAFRLNMAFGYTSEQAMKMTDGLLKLGSGIGADNEQLKRMAYNLAQVRLQGKVTALDVRQLALAGVDLEDVLKDVSRQFGYTITDHKEFNGLVADGKITWEQFAQGFSVYAEKYFGRSSEKMARTLIGLKSTFQDVFVLTMPRIIGPSIEKVTGVLGQLLDLFIKIRDTNILDALGNSWSKSMSKVLDPLTRMMDKINGYVDVWLAAKRLIKDGLMPQEAAAELTQMETPLMSVKTAFNEVFGQKTGTLIGKGVDFIISSASKVKNAFSSLFRGDVMGAAVALNAPKPILNFIDDVTKGIDNLKKFWDANGSQIKSIFKELVIGVLDFGGTKIGDALEGTGGFFERLTQRIVENGPQIVIKFREIKDYVLDELLPAIDQFIDKLINEWIPKAIEFGNYVKDNWQPILEKVVTIVLGLVAAFALFKTMSGVVSVVLSVLGAVGSLLVQIALAGGVTAFFSQLAAVASAALPVVGVILLVLVAAIAQTLTVLGGLALAGYLIWKNWNKLSSVFSTVYQVLSTALGPVLSDLKVSLSGFGAAWGELFTAIQPVLQLLGAVLIPVLKVLGAFIGIVLISAIAILTGVLTGLARLITSVINTLTAMLQSVALVVGGVVKFITGVFQLIKGAVTGNSDLIEKAVENMSKGIQQVIGGVLGFILTVVTGTFGALVSFFSGFANGVAAIWSAFWRTLANNTTGTMKQIATVISNGWNTILQASKEMGSKFSSVGTNIINGIKAGIQSNWGALVRWFREKIQELKNMVENVLDISSPSGVFKYFGRMIVAGLRIGVSGIPDVLGSMVINPLKTLPTKSNVSTLYDSHASAYYAPIYQTVQVSDNSLSRLSRD